MRHGIDEIEKRSCQSPAVGHRVQAGTDSVELALITDQQSMILHILGERKLAEEQFRHSPPLGADALEKQQHPLPLLEARHARDRRGQVSKRTAWLDDVDDAGG